MDAFRISFPFFSVRFCFVGSKNCIEWCLENPQPLCPLFCAIFHQLLFDKYYFVLLSGEFWVLVASGFMWICLVLGFFPVLLSCFSRCWCILSAWLLTFAPLLSGFTPVFTLCPLCIPLHIWFHHIQGCKMMSDHILFPPVFTLSTCFLVFFLTLIPFCANLPKVCIPHLPVWTAEAMVVTSTPF